MMRKILVTMSLIMIAVASCSSATPTSPTPTSPTPTLPIPTVPALTLESPTLSELEELADRAEVARDYGKVLGSWAIALETTYKDPENLLQCADFALVFGTADEIRNWKGNFAHYDGHSDPDYSYVSGMLSALQIKYNEFTALDKTDVGKEIQKYAENFENPTNGIAVDIQRGYIEVEYFFFILDPIWPEEYELLTDIVTNYEQKLYTIEQFLTTMEGIRQKRGCGLNQ